MGCSSSASRQKQASREVTQELAAALAAGDDSPGPSPVDTSGSRPSNSGKTFGRAPLPGAVEEPRVPSAETALMAARQAQAGESQADGLLFQKVKCASTGGAASPDVGPSPTGSARQGQRGPCRNPSDLQSLLAFVERVPLLSSLPRSDLPLLVKALRTQELEAGEVAIEQGALNDKLFIILAGKAAVVHHATAAPGDSDFEEVIVCSTPASQGGPRTLMTLEVGDYFGEQELLHAEPAQATVLATGAESLFLASVSHDAFWDLGLHKHLHIPKRRAFVELRADMRLASMQRSVWSEKSAEEKQVISQAVKVNAYLPLFCTLSDDVIEELVQAATRRHLDAGAVVMRQGDLHSAQFVIVESGSFQVVGQGRPSTSDGRRRSSKEAHFVEEGIGHWDAGMGAGSSFGEMELFTKCPCRATVTATEACEVWVVSQADFTAVLSDALQHRLERYEAVLQRVPMFHGLYKSELRALAEAVTEVQYVKGEELVTEGETGHTCFVLEEGELVLLRGGEEVDRRVASSSVAHVVGEEELLRPGPRLATIKAASEEALVLAINKPTFDFVLKPLDRLMHDIQEQGDGRRSVVGGAAESNKKWWEVASPKPQIDRAKLQLLCCLGQGEFGTVDLAVEKGSGRRFALRRCQRSLLVDDTDQFHVLNERRIMSMLHSPFILALHATFRDSYSVSFLLELAFGGDLRNAYLHNSLYGREESARFYGAGVVLALIHIHDRHIIHRDVKPDNVLLDARGWPKLSDFSLAKFAPTKTYTLCGTTAYIAPETLAQTGQDEAVDWWALGVLLYEMMAGRTPFEINGNVRETLWYIKRGIAKERARRWPWPTEIDRLLQSFLVGLLQSKPCERLPMQPGGPSNVQQHGWWSSVDWPAYMGQTLQPPQLMTAFEEAELPPCAGPAWDPYENPTTSWDEDF